MEAPADFTPAPTFEELKQHKIWMNAPAEGGKNPLDARTGRPGSPTDPKHWGPFDVAAATAERLGLHVGIALGPIAGTPWTLIGVDIDNAREGDKLRPFAEKMVDACA